MGKRPEKTSTKKIYGWQKAYEHMLYIIRYQRNTSLQVPLIKIKRYHYVPIRMATIQNTDKPNDDQEVEQQKFSLIAGENVKWSSHFGRQLAVSNKTKHTLTI